MDRIAVRLVIRGRVQGVGYRWWARGEAGRLRLDGWVRNLADGSVELVAAGPPQKVAEMVEASWRGPSGARVTAIDRDDASDVHIPAGFDERATP